MKKDKILSIIEIILIIVMAVGFFMPYFNNSSNTLIKSLGEAYTIVGFVFVLVGIIGSIFRKNELSYIACGYFIGVHIYLVATLSKVDTSFSVNLLGIGFYLQFFGAALTLLFTFIISLIPKQKTVKKEVKRNNAEVKTTINNGQMNMPVNSFQNIPVEIKEEEKTMPKPDLLAGVKTNDDSLFVNTESDSGFVTIPNEKPLNEPSGPSITMINNQTVEPVNNTLNINPEPVTEAPASMPEAMIGDVSVSAPVVEIKTEPPVVPVVTEAVTEASVPQPDAVQSMPFDIVDNAAPVAPAAQPVAEVQTEAQIAPSVESAPVVTEQPSAQPDQDSLINALTQTFNTGEPVIPAAQPEAVTEAPVPQTEAITEAPAPQPDAVQSMPQDMLGASPLGPVAETPSIDAGLPAPAPQPVEPVEPTAPAEQPVSMLGPAAEMPAQNALKTPESMLGNGPIPGPANIPQGMPPQGVPPMGMAPQEMPPQGVPPMGMAPQGMPPQGVPPMGMAPQGMPPQGMPPMGMPPQGMPMNNVGGILGGLPTPSQEGGQDIYNIMNKEPSMEEQMRRFNEQQQQMNNQNNNQANKPDLLAGTNLSGILGN